MKQIALTNTDKRPYYIIQANLLGKVFTLQTREKKDTGTLIGVVAIWKIYYKNKTKQNENPNNNSQSDSK